MENELRMIGKTGLRQAVENIIRSEFSRFLWIV